MVVSFVVCCHHCSSKVWCLICLVMAVTMFVCAEEHRFCWSTSVWDISSVYFGHLMMCVYIPSSLPLLLILLSLTVIQQERGVKITDCSILLQYNLFWCAAEKALYQCFINHNHVSASCTTYCTSSGIKEMHISSFLSYAALTCLLMFAIIHSPLAWWAIFPLLNIEPTLRLSALWFRH